MTLPVVKLNQGIHVMHLFYRVDRLRWAQLAAGESAQARAKLEALCATNASPSHPRLVSYTNVGGKADFVFMLQTAELGKIAQMHRELEACFAPGTLVPVFSYLSVTELTEYMPTRGGQPADADAAGKTGAGKRGFQDPHGRSGRSAVRNTSTTGFIPNCRIGR